MNRLRLTGSLTAGLLMIALSGLGQPALAAPLDLSGFTVTFNETFGTLDISDHGPGTRWIAHTPWSGDFGDAVFDNIGPHGPFAAGEHGPFTIGPQGLQIVARKMPDGKWHSGLICSMDRDGAGQRGFAQRYGYFEIKAKLPGGPGTWPAFWLVGTDKTSSSVEINVFEYYGKFPNAFHSAEHIWKGGKDVLGLDRLTDVPEGLLTEHFNRFGVLVAPDRTRFYLNRQEIWDTATPPEYRQPLYILANLALGGGWPIEGLESPASMAIEYIRVFQKRSFEAAGP